mmetsp:Transcript_47185/g.109116  ORF Transcript_47185/g.109116 Transcript_47185/m.109116 type:complete len:201 (+) Transcript_47185:806-1408(+)
MMPLTTLDMFGKRLRNIATASKSGNFSKFVDIVVVKNLRTNFGDISEIASLMDIRFTSTRFITGSVMAASIADTTEATNPADTAPSTRSNTARRAMLPLRLAGGNCRRLPGMTPATRASVAVPKATSVTPVTAVVWLVAGAAGPVKARDQLPRRVPASSPSGSRAAPRRRSCAGDPLATILLGSQVSAGVTTGRGARAHA